MNNQNSFLNSLESVMNEKYTENGAPALKSTKNAMIDLFGTIGAMRNRSELDIIGSFISAYLEDRLLAMKTLFYARDIREGLGERNVFRIIANYMADSHPEDMKANLELISEYGRWDDYYAFVGTKLEKDAFAILKKQFETDLMNLKSGKSVSLLGKWLKSQNASSVETKNLGILTAKYFFPEIDDKNRRSSLYRRALSKLRNAIDIVERKMSSNDWKEIKYDAVPSQASANYREAFLRNDNERYTEFISAVQKGESKINSSVSYPYEIARKYSRGCYDGKISVDATLEEMWKALPNYVTEDRNYMILADVSGSMYGLPMDVSVSLAVYFAQRNKGAFHGKFMTFESQPSLISIKDNGTLAENLQIVGSAPWGGSTDLYAAFRKLLDAAVRGKVKAEEMPEALIVITDMEINGGWSSNGFNDNFTETMRKEFNAAGYALPTLVWWNVNARQDTFHAEFKDPNVRFISGCSATIFKSLCENLGNTSEELMLLTLNSERYAAVKVVE